MIRIPFSIALFDMQKYGTLQCTISIQNEPYPRIFYIEINVIRKKHFVYHRFHRKQCIFWNERYNVFISHGHSFVVWMCLQIKLIEFKNNFFCLFFSNTCFFSTTHCLYDHKKQHYLAFFVFLHECEALTLHTVCFGRFDNYHSEKPWKMQAIIISQQSSQ